MLSECFLIRKEDLENKDSKQPTSMNFHFSANSNLNVHILILSPKIEVFPQRVETEKQVESDNNH